MRESTAACAQHPRSLTSDPEKFKQYSAEGYLALLPELDMNRIPNALRDIERHALIVIQADCIARRSAGRCLAFLTANSFVPIRSVKVRISPNICDALWHFASHESTADSLELARVVCNKDDSLLVLLRDVSPQPSMPASVRLTQLKGATTPSKRSAHHLRTVLQSPNELIVLVHTSDEPLDMIRETAIILGASAMDFLATMQESDEASVDAQAQLQRQIASLYGQAEPNDLIVENAFQRLNDALGASGLPAHARQLADDLRHVQNTGARIAWYDFARALSQAAQDPLSWDAMIVAADHILVSPTCSTDSQYRHTELRLSSPCGKDERGTEPLAAGGPPPPMGDDGVVRRIAE